MKLRHLLPLLLLLIVPVRAQATTYSCTNGRYSAGSDTTVTNADTINLAGTSGAHCLVKMNGFRWIIGGSSPATITLAYADVYDCGSASAECIAGSSGGTAGALSNTAVSITYSSFHRSGPVANVTSSGTTSITFNYNRYSSDNVGPASHQCCAGTEEQPMLTETGTSTAAKTFKGNIIERSFPSVASPNWTLGVPNGTTCAAGAADSNFIVGRRAGFIVNGTSGASYARCNYVRALLDVLPNLSSTSEDESSWTQVSCISGVGSAAVAEYNVVRQCEWTAEIISGELRYNILGEQHPHEEVRVCTGGLVHHNITYGMYPGIDRYLVGYYPRIPQGDVTMGLDSGGQACTIYNNTLDARGLAVASLMSVVSGATLTAWRNNVGYGLTLFSSNCATGPGVSYSCSSAVGPDLSEGNAGSPARASQLDYNDTYFDSGSTRKVVYGIGISGQTVCVNFATHDLGTCNGQGLDPQFKGQIAIGSGRTGTGCSPCTTATTDSGFPFAEGDLVPTTPGGTAKYIVDDLLTWYRYVYAPGASSPLLSAGSDGAHMGAVAAADIPGSAPSIYSTNKPPMVYAGPSFTCDLSDNICGGTTIGTISISLSGYGADDGKPSQNLTFAWTKIAGPSGGTITDATKANTTVTGLTNIGTYIYRVTATDGVYTSQSDAKITVQN